MRKLESTLLLLICLLLFITAFMWQNEHNQVKEQERVIDVLHQENISLRDQVWTMSQKMMELQAKDN